MTPEQKFQRELMDEVLQWDFNKIYNVFGPYLETVVKQQREKLVKQLGIIWRNREWYAFKDTGEQFDKDSMLCYFNGKKLSKYSLYDMEHIIERLKKEAVYSNPKKKFDH